MAEPEPERMSISERLQAGLGRRVGPGELGLVLARAGVGKTALCVQLALGEMRAGRHVVHAALGQGLSQIEAVYRALFAGDLPALCRYRSLQAFAEQVPLEHLGLAVETLAGELGIDVSLLLVDGFDWSAPGPELGAALRALKRQAGELGASLWTTATTHRDKRDGQTGLPESLQACEAEIDLLVTLEPCGARVCARAADATTGAELWLLPGSLRLAEREEDLRLASSDCTLLSGAHRGAEAAFGACAERWGIAERNFTFAGRPVARSRGLVLLDERELEQGDVSWAYLDDRMHRDYPRTDAFRKVLQSIWHQVNPAGEVFAVGKIKKDGTVKGGTGWAVELAKRLGKPVCVFDQEQQRWFFWESSWQPTEPPRIQRPAFCGTGTARLSEPGEQAIRELFERSFGSPEAHD